MDGVRAWLLACNDNEVAEPSMQRPACTSLSDALPALCLTLSPAAPTPIPSAAALPPLTDVLAANYTSDVNLEGFSVRWAGGQQLGAGAAEKHGLLAAPTAHRPGEEVLCLVPCPCPDRQALLRTCCHRQAPANTDA